MAKIRHNNFIDTVSEISQNAKNKGVMQLYTEDEFFTGRQIQVNGKNLFHFGTTGYLGLEQDSRLKKAAVEAIMKYGTQFPLSKTYLSFGVYKELEDRLYQMYGYPVVVTKNSTLGHLGIIPTVVRDEDGIILDHQVHWSVQNACQIAKNRGIPVEMIRHNDMQMLEDRIKEFSSRCSRIWYFADGIYSMFGDVAPIDTLKSLCAKYSQLHLYFDDVHGMSWVGKHGTGYVLSQYGDDLPENVIVVTTLSKTFGASGATMITSDPEIYTKVKNFGGPLTFSAQLEPASVAAASASAAIHLTDEIYAMQQELAGKIHYCNTLLDKTDLPLVERNNCPVFYIGAGAPAVGYNIVKKLLDAGFFVNMGIFPAVPVKQTGIRFTISRHNRKKDIKALVEAINHLHPIALKEESYTKNQVRRIFKLPLLAEDDEEKKALKADSALSVKATRSINEIDPVLWNSLMGGNSVFDHAGMQFLESAFRGHEQSEHNWDFYYYLITDRRGKPVLATFFTQALWKDDMLAPESVSMELEERRQEDPYYLSSHVLSMGSVFTEGDHLFIDKKHAKWREALDLLVTQLEGLDEALDPSMLVMRDFREDEPDFDEYFNKKGFIKIDLPESCIVEDLSWKDTEEYLKSLSSRSRKHFRKDIEPFLQYFDVEVCGELDDSEVDRVYQLYRNVWKNNLAMNTFCFARDLFLEMSGHANWEFIKLRFKGTDAQAGERPLVAIMFCYKNQGIGYVPAFIGMDYEYVRQYSVYRQMLFHTIVRARQLGFKKVDFGLSASFEKKKVGATITPKVAYIQAKNNFSMEMMGAIQRQ